MTFQRSQGRAADALRPITITRQYTKHAEGSVLIEFGATKVLCTASVEDSACDTDMNVVMTAGGGFVEVQGTAEGASFSRDEMGLLLGLADKGIRELIAAQRRALGL